MRSFSAVSSATTEDESSLKLNWSLRLMSKRMRQIERRIPLLNRLQGLKKLIVPRSDYGHVTALLRQSDFGLLR